MDEKTYLDFVNHVSSLSLQASNVVLRTDILRRLVGLFRATSGQFFRTMPSGTLLNIETMVSCNIPENIHLAFQTRHYKYSPFHDVRLLSTRRVTLGTEVLDSSALLDHPYYQKFMKPQSILHQLIIPLRSGEHLIGVIYLHRKEGEPGFSEGDVKRAQVLVPLLSIILHHTILRVSLLGLRTVIESLLKDLPYEGVVVLNTALEPVFSSAYAERVFFHSLNAIENPAGFRSMLPEELVLRCRQILDATDEPAAGVFSELNFDLFLFPDGEETAVALKCLRFDIGDKYILICLSKEEPRLPLSQQLRKIGVSPRELDVVFLVYQGMKNVQIADKLFISEHTVENHLRSIYQKLDVNSRTALIHELVKRGSRSSYLIPFQNSPSL